jgi:hypothetical protein
MINTIYQVVSKAWPGLLISAMMLAACGGGQTGSAAATQTPDPAVAVVSPNFEPLLPATCEELRDLVAAVLRVEATINETSFTDYVNNVTGTGCQIIATGTGADFPHFVEVATDLQSRLEGQGWVQDQRYLGDGPTGTISGFWQNDQLCLLEVGWEPAEGVDCPADQPISACEIPPEQQLYTISLNCAQAPNSDVSFARD